MRSHKALTDMCVCAVFAAMLCFICPISSPIGPIPITLSVFAVLLCGVVLDLRYAFCTIAVYLLLGLFLPVFSGGNTGLAAFPGPTGGYIWSYLLMIPVIRGVLSLPVRGRYSEYLLALCGCTAATAVCYLCGTIQFSVLTGRGFSESLSVCVAPFLGFDALKILAASALGVPLRRLLRKLS